MSKREFCQLGGAEPSKVVVLVGRCIDRLPLPSPDQERVDFERRIADRHRNALRVEDANPELFGALPRHGYLRRLPCLDVAADEVPAVWIPAALRVSVHHEETSIANQRGNGNGYAGRHAGTLQRRRSSGRGLPLGRRTHLPPCVHLELWFCRA